MNKDYLEDDYLKRGSKAMLDQFKRAAIRLAQTLGIVAERQFKQRDEICNAANAKAEKL